MNGAVYARVGDRWQGPYGHKRSDARAIAALKSGVTYSKIQTVSQASGAVVFGCDVELQTCEVIFKPLAVWIPAKPPQNVAKWLDS